MNEHMLDSVDRMLAASTEHTQGMVALLPRSDQAELLALKGFELASELHVTLLFLGEADTYDEGERLRMQAFVADGAKYVAPVQAEAWAVAQFNPHTSDSCAVYLVGRGPLEQARDMLIPYSEHVPEQHRPWVPHLTIGYGLPVTRLTHAGLPLTFDRVRIAFAGEYHDYPLVGQA